MEYKNFKIMANAKSYSLWSIDDDGRLDELEHEYEGYDLLSYVIISDKYKVDEGSGDYTTLDKAKQAIDKIIKEENV